MRFIITFYDVSGSLRTEQVLKHRGFPCVVDAAPRSLGTSCVYIIRTEAQTQGELAAILDDAGIGWAKILETPEGPEGASLAGSRAFSSGSGPPV